MESIYPAICSDQAELNAVGGAYIQYKCRLKGFAFTYVVEAHMRLHVQIRQICMRCGVRILFGRITDLRDLYSLMSWVPDSTIQICTRSTREGRKDRELYAAVSGVDLYSNTIATHLSLFIPVD